MIILMPYSTTPPHSLRVDTAEGVTSPFMIAICTRIITCVICVCARRIWGRGQRRSMLKQRWWLAA